MKLGPNERRGLPPPNFAVRASNFLRIVLIAAALASYSAWAQTTGKPRTQGNTIAGTDGLVLVERTEAERLWREPTTLFLDVRALGEYLGGHIEGAIHLPGEQLAGRLPELRPRLERATTLVVYCKSADCGKSLWAAIALRNAGLTQVVIYPNGWNEWVLAGKPAFKAEY